MRETIDVVSGPQTSTRNGERFRSAGSGNRTLLAVIALIAIGAALRLYRLDAQSVWYDEAYSIMLARESVGTISTQVIGDHLPLYFVMLHYWAALAGQTEFAVRYLSLLFDLATIAAIYALGKRLVGTAEGSVAGGLAAFSPFLVYYSQETRMYTFLVFLATSSTYVLHRATRDEPRLWLAYGLLATAMAYTHYLQSAVPRRSGRPGLSPHSSGFSTPKAARTSTTTRLVGPRRACGRWSISSLDDDQG